MTKLDPSVVQDPEAPTAPFFNCESTVGEPLSDSKAWHFHEALIGTSTYCRSLQYNTARKLQCDVSVFQGHATDKHILHTHTDKNTHTLCTVQYNTALTAFEYQKALQVKEKTHILLNRWWDCVYVCVWVSMHWPRTERQEHWGCDDCFAVHRMAPVVPTGTSSPE